MSTEQGQRITRMVESAPGARVHQAVSTCISIILDHSAAMLRDLVYRLYSFIYARILGSVTWGAQYRDPYRSVFGLQSCAPDRLLMEGRSDVGCDVASQESSGSKHLVKPEYQASWRLCPFFSRPKAMV